MMWLWFKAGCFQVVSTCKICKYMQISAKYPGPPPSNQQEYVDIRCYLKPRNQDHPRLPYPLAVLGAGIDFHQGIWRPHSGQRNVLGVSWVTYHHGLHAGITTLRMFLAQLSLSYFPNHPLAISGIYTLCWLLIGSDRPLSSTVPCHFSGG